MICENLIIFIIRLNQIWVASSELLNQLSCIHLHFGVLVLLEIFKLLSDHLKLSFSFTFLILFKEFFEKSFALVSKHVCFVLSDTRAVIHHFSDEQNISANELHRHLDKSFGDHENLLSVGIFSEIVQSLIHFILANNLFIFHEHQ